MKLETYPKNWRKVKDDFYSPDTNITFGSLTVDYYSNNWLCLRQLPRLKGRGLERQDSNQEVTSLSLCQKY